MMVPIGGAILVYYSDDGRKRKVYGSRNLMSKRYDPPVGPVPVSISVSCVMLSTLLPHETL